MNTCILSGRITAHATTRGTKTRVVTFVLETKNGYDEEKKQPYTALVSCVMFNPLEPVEEMLTRQGKGLCVELEGRVSSSRYEVRGEQKFSTDVIVKNHTFMVVKAQ